MRPLTFKHQGIVVMNLEAQISGGARASEGKTCFFGVVESLEAEGGCKGTDGVTFLGIKLKSLREMSGHNPDPHHGLRDMTCALDCAWKFVLLQKASRMLACTCNGITTEQGASHQLMAPRRWAVVRWKLRHVLGELRQGWTQIPAEIGVGAARMGQSQNGIGKGWEAAAQPPGAKPSPRVTGPILHPPALPWPMLQARACSS